ncbi:alpha/beta hydrolase [Limosilactobacillus balticus]|uniref:alpha/beta hydrolase n=1 Tax=Limosilactobacillus balticus TaxID=2759747 RepID=UPI002175ECE9|nr:alpha/beta hydrolase [Limosilactobacillus balticus]
MESVANLYLPADYSKDKTYAAIVVAHPNGGVKEQVSGLFAQKLAEAGYISLAYDAAYQGASEGMPRQTDLPASLDYLLSVNGVDPQRVGALGICGGGGYTLQTAKSDKRIKAVVTISMFNTGRVRRNSFKDADMANIQKWLTEASEAREKFATTGEVEYIGQLFTRRTHFTKEELEKIPAGLYRDGVQYYGDTHYHPNAQSRYTTMSLLGLMTFDVDNQADLLN